MLDDVGNLLVFAMGGSGQQPVWLQFVPFAMVLAIFYFLILLPMKRQRKKVEEFQTSLKVGDKVVTTGGIYGVRSRGSTTIRSSSRSPTRSASKSRGRPSAATRARSPWCRIKGTPKP